MARFAIPKQVFYLVCIGFFYTLSSSFVRIGKEDPQWLLDKTVSKVDLYHMVTQCNGREVVFLKMKNRNDQKVKVSWDEAVSLSNEPTHSGWKGKKSFVLDKGEEAEADCSSKLRALLVTGNDVNPTRPVKFGQYDFQNVSVQLIH